MNAWPSPRQVLLDGWLLRLAGGPTRRTNSINPLRSLRYDPGEVMGDCARVYATAGQPLLFRVPTMATGMGQALESLAFFAVEGETITLFDEDVGSATMGFDASVEVSERPTEDWHEFRSALNGSNIAADRIFREMTGCIALPKAFSAVRHEGAVASIAYGAIDRRLLVIESVATAEALRQRGFARRTIAGLMRWAAAQGAEAACLQVVAANTSARILYDKLGFKTELYRYHYRRENPDLAPEGRLAERQGR